MTNHTLTAFAILAAGLVMASCAPADAPTAGQPAAQPLAPFERLIGRWQLADSQQEFAWGVGRRSVIARSYFLIDGEPTLVAEGMWYWHPGEKEIRGIVTAINMPVVFFDYTTRFDDDRMVSELTSYDKTGEASEYVEIFSFVDGSQYEWALLSKTGRDLQQVMTGTYTRQ